MGGAVNRYVCSSMLTYNFVLLRHWVGEIPEDVQEMIIKKNV